MYGCYQESKMVLTAVHVIDNAAAVLTLGITLLTERLEQAENYNGGSTEVTITQNSYVGVAYTHVATPNLVLM